MSASSRTLYLLLTGGICDYTEAVDIGEINSLLRPLGYEAVVWPSRSHFVLRDHAEPVRVAPPWTEAMVEEAKKVFVQISMRERVVSPLLPFLEETGWVVYDECAAPVLSKRALVQFEKFLTETKGRYKKCLVCSFVVDSDDYHKYCRDMLSRK